MVYVLHKSLAMTEQSIFEYSSYHSFVIFLENGIFSVVKKTTFFVLTSQSVNGVVLVHIFLKSGVILQFNYK